MANYLKVTANCTVTSGNFTESFVVDELVSPYSMWADPLTDAGLVVDSGQVAPEEDLTPRYPYFTASLKYRNIFEITTATALLNIDFLQAEVHGNSSVAQTFTIPNDNNSRMNVGAYFWVRQMGTAGITIAAQTGVTIRNPYGLSTPARYSSLFLIKVADNDWVVYLEAGSGGTATTDTDDQTAAEVPFSPPLGSGLSSVNVQNALVELDTEKETPAGAQAKADAAQAAAENTASTLYQPVSQKGLANGYAALDANGKIPTTQLPALAITDVSVVADIAARDALTVQEGDVAVVTDAGGGTSATYIYDGVGWQNLSSGGSTVVASDVAFSPVGNIAATTVQTALAEVDAEKETPAGAQAKADAAQAAAETTAANTYQPLSGKGQANGYASLNANGKVPAAQLALHGGTP